MNPKFDPKDPHMFLASGKPFYFSRFTTGDIHLSDIFHSLARQTRFNGHTRVPYSVARHSCLVYDLVAQRTKDHNALKWALLHDAAEAYIGDIVSPVKRMCHEVQALESGILYCVGEKFCDGRPIPDLVHRMDSRACKLEMKWLMGPPRLGSFGLPKEPLSPLLWESDCRYASAGDEASLMRKAYMDIEAGR